jgi:metallophosphoesterase (TIGR00282 family)
MNLLYIGDVMGEMGMQAVEKILPELKQSRDIQVVLAQVENVTEGRGITPNDFARLQRAGVDCGTGGNWSLWREEINSLMADPLIPIVRPANYPAGTPGLPYKYLKTPAGNILIVTLLGHVVGRDADKETDNPLKTIDKILADEPAEKRIATVVNFHGDYSSEKFVIGYYLDGRVSLIVGDHWHIPTADASVLPKGTAHMSDVGMCGSLDSSLGVTLESIIPRWRDGLQTRNVLATNGRSQFNALLVELDEQTGKATNVEHIRRVW